MEDVSIHSPAGKAPECLSPPLPAQCFVEPSIFANLLCGAFDLCQSTWWKTGLGRCFRLILLFEVRLSIFLVPSPGLVPYHTQPKAVALPTTPSARSRSGFVFLSPSFSLSHSRRKGRQARVISAPGAIQAASPGKTLVSGIVCGHPAPVHTRPLRLSNPGSRVPRGETGCAGGDQGKLGVERSQPDLERGHLVGTNKQNPKL